MFRKLDGPALSLLAILKTFQLADCAGLLWMLRVDRFAAHVALASTKNRYYSIAWLRPSFFLSLYCSQWKRRSRDRLETDKMSGRFWVFVSGRFCDRTEEREKLRRAEDLPPKTEGFTPLYTFPFFFFSLDSFSMKKYKRAMEICKFKAIEIVYYN